MANPERGATLSRSDRDFIYACVVGLACIVWATSHDPESLWRDAWFVIGVFNLGIAGYAARLR